LLGWRSESLWGIRTAQDIRSSLDVFRGRKAPSLGQIPRAADPMVDPGGAERVDRIARRERSRFERQDRAVRRQQAQALKLRARLEKTQRNNRMLQQVRASLVQERRASLRQIRDAFRKERRAEAGS
jgi:predicted RNase H-like nuclease (RuvC/YqgF family)